MQTRQQNYGNRLAKEARERQEAREWDLAERWRGIENGTVTTEQTHPVIARINEVMEAGRYERGADGSAMMKIVIPGASGPERFYYNLVLADGDAAIAFFSADRFGHSRRALVTERGLCYVQVEANTVIGTDNKYSRAAADVMMKRAAQLATRIAAGAWNADGADTTADLVLADAGRREGAAA